MANPSQTGDNDLRVQLLLTGNEIMSGDTVDSNSSMIAHHLSPYGISVQRKVTLADDLQHLIDELRAMTSQADVVIMNGGLGPTIDDLTAQVLAEVAGVTLEEHPEAMAHLNSWCKQRNTPLNAANLKQAMLPRDCTVIPNPVGSAVGFEMTIGQCRVLCTPGVPSELRAMLGGIVQSIAGSAKGNTRVIRLQTFGIGESTAQQLVSDHLPDWPDSVDLGFRASLPQMEIKLTSRSAPAHDVAQSYAKKLHQLFEHHIIGRDNTTLAGEVLRLLTARGATMTTAESCTGGLIASELTAIAGASAAFHAGFVTYDNRIKHKILNVSEDLLLTHGAVSNEVVCAMARGALAAADADYVVAASGIAGPDGGTPDKPVGTVWLAWGDKHNIESCCLYWPFSRTKFQQVASAAALDLLRRRLLGAEDDPIYIKQRSAPRPG